MSKYMSVQALRLAALSVHQFILGLRLRTFASHQWADYARMPYAGAGEVCVARVTFAVWCL